MAVGERRHLLMEAKNLSLRFTVEVNADDLRHLLQHLAGAENRLLPQSDGTSPSAPAVEDNRLQRALYDTRMAVTMKEAAEILGVCKRMLEREVDRGHLRALRIGRTWRVRMAEIRAYLERMERKEQR